MGIELSEQGKKNDTGESYVNVNKHIETRSTASH